jgi:hypothetical protein
MLPHSLISYKMAPSDLGPLAYEWKDKPHRLVYDLVAEVTMLRKQINFLKKLHSKKKKS